MKIKPAIIGIAITVLMLGSVFTGIRSPSQLPKNNAISYRLNPQIREAFVYYGSTILTFDYNLDCDNCFEQKGFLEAFVNTYKVSLATDFYNIYLEEILNETLKSSRLTIESKLGNKTLTNPTQNEALDAICDLMFAAPTVCVVR